MFWLRHDQPHQRQRAVGPIAQALCEPIAREFIGKVDPAVLDDHWKAGVPMPSGVSSKAVATGIVASLAAGIVALSTTTADLTVKRGPDKKS
jgi:hypothetical protein